MRLPTPWRSLRTQLIFWNILALFILLAGLGLVIRYTVVVTMIASVDQALDARTRGRPSGPGRRPPPPQGFSPGGRSFPPGFQGPPGPFERQGRRPPPDADDPFRPRRFDRSGQMMEPFGRGSFSAAVLDPPAFARALRQGKPVYSTVTVNGDSLRVLYRPFPAQPPFVGAVQALYSLTEVNRAIGGLNRALLVLIPFALLCAGAGGAALTDQVLRRVRRLAEAAARIGASSFSERLPVLGRDEFSALTETFNGMLNRLEGAYQAQKRLVEQQRRFTADASHELKTPLTIIKGNASLALGGESDAAGYRQSLQDLLLLARSDGGQLGRDRIDLPLREVLDRALSGIPRTVETVPVTFTLANDSLRVFGNETELVRLFRNLLDNAVRHTPAEGSVHVQAVRKAAQVIVTVTDTGRGIAPKHLPHLGERFYRVDDSRSRPDGGTGLGLSICKGIVEAHGGTMTFRSEPGLGTAVTVTLPAEEPASER